MVKRLIGGLILLNLCAISLDVSAGEVDITNDGVLEQLKELRTFIDVKRDFSKESKQLKPVLVQYRSNASKIDGIVQCNMEFNTDALHLNICGTSIQKDGTPLTITINVVYEYTDYVGYTIKTAKLNATQNQPIFETIVDKNGNPRFIEEDIETETITGVTFSYAKWSLSGTHLMIVICGDVAPSTAVSANTKICDIELPDYIKDKISTIYSTWVASKNAECIEEVTYSHATFLGSDMDKTEDGLTLNSSVAIISSENKRHFRLAFDLLIDSASEE